MERRADVSAAGGHARADLLVLGRPPDAAHPARRAVHRRASSSSTTSCSAWSRSTPRRCAAAERPTVDRRLAFPARRLVLCCAGGEDRAGATADMTQHTDRDPAVLSDRAGALPLPARAAPSARCSPISSATAPAALNDILTQGGFRRSQNIAYRPACEGCRACISVRVVVDAFAPTGSMTRVREAQPRRRRRARPRRARRPTSIRCSAPISTRATPRAAWPT